MKQINKIDVIGTGFIAQGFVMELEGEEGLEVSKVLIRRNIQECPEFSR